MPMRRLKLGMSQRELGRAIGVSFQQIQKYERSKNTVRGSQKENPKRGLTKSALGA